MDWSQIAQQALEEHKKLGREIEILKLRLAAPAESSISKWMVHCTEHFRHFYTLLRQHMEMEERGGFMKVVREHRPSLDTIIDKLQDEHGTMRQSCRDIEVFLECCTNPTPEDVEEIRQRTQALLVELHRHKAEENKLVQDAFTQDIGAGD